MKKTILFIGALTLGLHAFNAEVKKGAVSLLVNDVSKEFEAGSKFSLKAGDLVCFVSGEGRVVIKGDKYSKQLSKHSKSCKRLPFADKKGTDYLALANERLVEHFGKAQESSVSGVSTRAVSTGKVLTEPLILSEEVKYIVIENEMWGPLPVTIRIFDTKGGLVATETNEEELLTSFIFPVSLVKEGYRIEVSNAFDEPLVKASVHFQNSQTKK